MSFLPLSLKSFPDNHSGPAFSQRILGLETRWTISVHQSLEFANSLYPSLKALSQLLKLSSLGWIQDLNTYIGVALKLGLSNEYDETSAEEMENEFRYSASLAWTL